MKNIRIILMTMLFFLAFSTPVFADSYTIDKVHIRAWIQPNGDLLLNEVFKYTFKGDYHRVRRSIQTDHHEGVTSFYAYELLNPDAEPGFVKEQDLRALKVTQEDNSYYAALPAEDEEKTVFFVYHLKDAVKSYETYSDLVVPFFGTGSNHDQDLHDVTIDFVFPEEIEPGHYDAFLHDRETGNIQKDRVVVRFTTPISPMYSLTETRLLFPSSVMTEQKKIAAPVSLEKAIEQEKTLAKQMARNKQKREQLQHALPYLTIVMGVGCLILMTLSLLRRLRSSGSMKELLHTDPLVLYFIHRLGKKDRYGYFAALYSLVEKGAAKVKLDKTSKRFQHDPEAPDYQLLFTLKDTSVSLKPHENKLISWLFKKLGKKSKNSFSMMNAAGTTKKEKDEQRQLLGYQGKQLLFKQGEKEWLDAALHHMKAEGLMSDKLIRLLVPLLLAIVFSVVLYSYMLDSLSKGAMLTYSIIAAILFWLAWRNPAKRWRSLLFFFASFIAALMLYDAALVKQVAILIPAAALLYLLTPRMTLSSEAAMLYEDIRQFRKQVRKQGLPLHLPEAELEKWAVRSLILKTRQSRSSFGEIAAVKADLFSFAPLAFLLSEDHDPVSYLENTWKWSKAVSTDSSSGGGSYDSGGFFSSDSGGGGGDGGGGGGAD
ncbi:DUF2207 domain-containing protein [Pseudobacillus wudalianchiensis]|uniref:DUF2207 domain-containing protein n=1 Tax=Pseudobacillus wudalianchiensis TaxID=1743143 RepID=A0A1B9AAI2_9BACI|nr:DUF2207 domain-containing protein [Bacillus wudalianchiensis]OCA80852.1 hypothetical protein A8F95_17235 [Bacillus wudalianchiensis]